MIDLNNIKSILQVAGITSLKIAFDNDRNLVNADYVFRKVHNVKQITYQEIINSLSIGLPGPPAGTGADLAPSRVDGSFELKDLPGEK